MSFTDHCQAITNWSCSGNSIYTRQGDTQRSAGSLADYHAKTSLGQNPLRAKSLFHHSHSEKLRLRRVNLEPHWKKGSYQFQEDGCKHGGRFIVSTGFCHIIAKCNNEPRLRLQICIHSQKLQHCCSPTTT